MILGYLSELRQISTKMCISRTFGHISEKSTRSQLWLLNFKDGTSQALENISHEVTERRFQVKENVLYLSVDFSNEPPWEVTQPPDKHHKPSPKVVQHTSNCNHDQIHQVKAINLLYFPHNSHPICLINLLSFQFFFLGFSFLFD